MESIKNQINSPSVVKFSHTYPISVEISADFSKNDLLSIDSSVYLKDVWPSSGLTKISARAIFNLLYKEDGSINNYESGADLSYDISNEKITSDNVIDVYIKIIDTEMRKTASGINEITATVLTTVYVCTTQNASFVENIEDAVVKKENFECYEFISSSLTSFNVDGEKEFPYFIEKVLCHQSYLKITGQTASVGEVIVEGEIYSQFLLLKKSGETVTQTVVTPFRYEIERSDCSVTCKTFAFGNVGNALFKVSSQEGDSGSVITAEYLVNVRVSLFNLAQKSLLADGFSPKCELEFDTDELSFLANLENSAFNHKVFGEGDIAFEEGQKILGVISSDVQISDYENQDNNLEISGVVTCKILSMATEGEQSSTTSRLPFTCSFKCERTPVYINAYAKNPLVRNLDGKCIIESEIAFDVNLESRASRTFITDTAVGEEKEERVCAISVVFINKGDDLWSVCKKACCEESVLLANNPDLTFPATSDKAVVVYHKL